MAHIVDFRSDTVTKPSEEMRQYMANAEVGDDVYGEDPTVNHLEEMGAALLGMESALYASSGTQTNLLALLTHCGRGDEYIVGQTAHIYKYEAGGGAVLGSIQPQPIEVAVDGTLPVDCIESVVKPLDFHFARSRLLCLENTNNGLALPLDYLRRAHDCARKHRLRLHLDGARIFNAATKSGVGGKDISRYFDSVSVCLSKGLGAPVGSLLCGNREFVAEARRWRKMLGGGMRQAGLIAAAGIYALSHNIERLREDHDNATTLATGLQEIEELEVEYEGTQTNMVFVTLSPAQAPLLRQFLDENEVLIGAGSRIRFVLHLGITAEDVMRTIRLIRQFFD